MTEPNTKEPIEVLIAEDSATQAERLRYILERHQYRVRLARNGEQALQMMHDRVPAIVISDVVMPKMGGYELCRRIRADEKLRSVPVILLTSLADVEEVMKGLECGADNFLTKPYDEAYLISRIEHIFENPHLRVAPQKQEILEVFFGGKKHVLPSAPSQTLNLLLSIYETAVQRNEALIKAQEELQRANDQLAQRTAQLEHANGELEAFTHSVTHDLRAPLRAIKMFSAFLVQDFAAELSPEARDYVDRIQNGSVRMNELIDDLLKLFGASKGRIELQPVNLSTIASSIIDELRRANPERSVDVTIAPAVIATGDESLLRVVMENLLNNAWKFTSKQPSAQIAFGTLQSGNRQVNYVRDNGAGFNMALAAKLFMPFQRLHSGAEFAGTGIGLATVKRIVDRHNGEVWAESSPGQGATFFFTLNEREH